MLHTIYNAHLLIIRKTKFCTWMDHHTDLSLSYSKELSQLMMFPSSYHLKFLWDTVGHALDSAIEANGEGLCPMGKLALLTRWLSRISSY